MPDINFWPWIALGAWCFSFTAGVAWAAMWRPTQISITLRVGDDDA